MDKAGLLPQQHHQQRPFRFFTISVLLEERVMPMGYNTVFVTTDWKIVPWTINPFRFDHLSRRISFSRLRWLESKYGLWEFWAKELFGWILERWEYLLLEQVVSSQKKRKLLIGCVMQRKTPGKTLHFEHLTGSTLATGAIHISRLAGTKLERLHLLRFFLAIYDYANENRASYIYAVMRSGLLRSIKSMVPHDFLEVVSGEHFHRGGHEFIPVKINIASLTPFADMIRNSFGASENRFPLKKGNNAGLKQELEPDTILEK